MLKDPSSRSVCWNLPKKKAVKLTLCVTVTDLKRDDSTLVLDNEQDACSLNTYLVNG